MIEVRVTHDMLVTGAILALAAWLLLRTRPPTRAVAAQPAPRRADLGDAPELGSEKVTELRPASRATSA